MGVSILSYTWKDNATAVGELMEPDALNSNLMHLKYDLTYVVYYTDFSSFLDKNNALYVDKATNLVYRWETDEYWRWGSSSGGATLALLTSNAVSSNTDTDYSTVASVFASALRFKREAMQFHYVEKGNGNCQFIISDCQQRQFIYRLAAK